jgi:hypothetical protein
MTKNQFKKNVIGETSRRAKYPLEFKMEAVRLVKEGQAMDEVIDWLTCYNHRQLHSTLVYVSPMQFEKRLGATQQLKAA